MTTERHQPGRPFTFRALPAGLLLLSLTGIVSCSAGQPAQSPETQSLAPKSAATTIDGVKVYDNLSSKHVTDKVAYAQSPAVGGDHYGRWTNCGVYSAPVEEMRAVHSMEHGAVWVTYRPDLPATQVQELTGAVDSKNYVLVSPYPGQASPITLTAWGLQLTIDSPSDPRFQAFLSTYIQGEQTPEPGAPCTGGIDG